MAISWETGLPVNDKSKVKRMTFSETQLREHDKQIRADAIKEFAHELKETFNQEFPSNYPSTKPFFTLENARMLVDEQIKNLEV